jgi:hypothetical protein
MVPPWCRTHRDASGSPDADARAPSVWHPGIDGLYLHRVAFITLLTLTTVSCGSEAPRGDLLPGTASAIRISPVPLDPREPRTRSIGAFVYAGGVEISSADPAITLELSGLRIGPGERLVAVGDQGIWFDARLLLDDGELVGLADVQTRPLVGESGQPLADEDADAEGVELLPDGSRLVVFEGRDRIWLYPGDGSAPRPAPMPDAVFLANQGLEAITLFPAAGADAYLVGTETGTIWLCRLSAACTETPLGGLVPPGFGLTGLSSHGRDGDFAMLSRAYDAVRGVRISLRLVATRDAPSGRLLDEMTITPPLTVDNFEGVAVVPRAGGGIRVYLVSDDNGSSEQRTYLLAFDWQPPR